MSNTLIIQSSSARIECDALECCIHSVRQWARLQGYNYRMLGDEIFDRVPQWYLDKVKDKLPVATDYARLVLIRDALEQDGFERAIWLDADTLIFDLSLELNWSGSCGFGQEVWVQRDARGKLKATRNVHNAVCGFTRNCATLPFLQETVLSIIRRIDPDHIAPQVVGPKLLSALHSITGFSLLPQVGAFSPDVLNELVKGSGPALELMLAKSLSVPKAANLGLSVAEPKTMLEAIRVLNALGGPLTERN